LTCDFWAVFEESFFYRTSFGSPFRLREEMVSVFASVPAFARAVAEFVKLLGNHHKVVVQLPMRHRIVDLSFLGAAEPSNAKESWWLALN
jgi:hypothetical protein